MKHIIGFLAMLLPLLSGAQAVIKPLKIGDEVPGITLTNVYNYPDSILHLSDLKGKLVILDFWSTWCTNCIAAFPKSQKLQHEFSDKIQIILVDIFDHDDKDKVQSMFKRNKRSTGFNVLLPYSLLQSSLADYFPFKYIPHYVWIDKNGKVIATTSQEELTSVNVADAMNDNVAGIHMKKDLVDFSPGIPLLVNGNGGNDSNFLYRSLFTKYIEGAGSSENIYRDNNGKITRYYMLNTPPIMLLRTAYPAKLNLPNNRIIVECNNKSSYQPSKIDNNDYYNNLFCYGLIIPPSSMAEFRNYVKDDMKKYLGVTVVYGTRNLNCLVITKKGATNPIATKGGKPQINLDENSIQKIMANQPMAALIDLFNSLSAVPVIDETGIRGNIDINLPTGLFNMQPGAVKSFFQKKGFAVSGETRAIKVALIINQ